MREDIENIINEELNKIEFNLKDMDYSNNIEDLIRETNRNNKYKKDLIRQIEEMKKLGVNIEYSKDMTTTQLENLLKSVKF